MLGALAVGMAVGDEKPEPSEAKAKRQPRKRTTPRKAAANSDDRRSQPAAVALGGAKPARKAQGEEALREFNQGWPKKVQFFASHARVAENIAATWELTAAPDAPAPPLEDGADRSTSWA